MGGTIYPATFTAKGGGHKTDPNTGKPTIWTVNQTPIQGTLTVTGTQQMPTFQNSPISIPITSVPTGFDTVETPYPLASFPLTPNTTHHRKHSATAWHVGHQLRRYAAEARHRKLPGRLHLDPCLSVEARWPLHTKDRLRHLPIPTLS